MMKIYRTSRYLHKYLILLLLCIATNACGRKGDPVPNVLTKISSCSVRWSANRILEIKIPDADSFCHNLSEMDRVRIYYLSSSKNHRSTKEAILTKGQIIVDNAIRDIPKIGEYFVLNLQKFNYESGCLTIVVMRSRDLFEVSSEVLLWPDN